jgi:eukaryotic-like serine/threonine-protein kinase
LCKVSISPAILGLVPIYLGPFELEEPIARGGMGEIWRGRHAEQRLPVAIKVLSAREMQSDASRKLFRDEIQAMARLHHPGVIMVFDHGLISMEVAKLTQNRLRVGAPYLVMEYASRGSLKDQQGTMPWIQVRAVLLALLDALAHAHARGVVHRDIKPGNILLSGVSDTRPGLKLADFGLAHAVDRFDEVSQITGTPRYMAPEQFASKWRNFGPWTDLYALGMVAWELVCGLPPYDGDMKKIASGHMQGELPVFLPRVSVPEGFQEWLSRIAQRDPHLRFRRAADAAFQLAQLPEPELSPPLSDPTISFISNPTITLDDTLLLASGSHDDFHLSEVPTEDLRVPIPIRVPPLPATWKRAEPPEALLQLLGVGLGLFGVRSIPLVDRVHERDRLWEVLTESRREQQTRLVVLKGASGNGKSRLAQWISERAHEVGGAEILRAVHSPMLGPTDGLAPMVSRHYRCVALTRPEILSRLKREVTWESPDLPGEAEALTELLCSDSALSEGGVRLNSPLERYVLIRRVMERLARQRPVILWLDDVQWGADALDFAAYLLDDHQKAPVTLLLTVQEEALLHRDVESRQLEALAARPETTSLAVGPLAMEDRRELVRVLLGLEGSLAEQLADRAAGNPLFTVQLVDDWVSRGMLVPGQNGFELRPGVRADLPDTLHEVWTGRLARLLEHQPQDARTCLLIAAALGQEVIESEWRQVCRRAALQIPSQLVADLMNNRLALPTDGGWSFAHGMLRESLQRLATESDQWSAINLTCAHALSKRTGPPLHARLGRHLLAAGAYQDAYRHLEIAASKTLGNGDDARESRALLVSADEALRRLSPPVDDPRWGQLWLLRARMNASLTNLDESVRDAARTRSSARRYGWTQLLPRAISTLANVEKKRGNLLEAEQLYRIALPLFETQGDRRRIAGCLIALCHTQILGGDATGAQDLLKRAHGLYQAIGDFSGMAMCLRFSGDIARLDCDWPRARQLFLESNDMHLRAGNRPHASSALHGVAEMDRLLGNLQDAENGYRAVIQLNDARGVYSAIPRLNLALCLIERGHFSEAKTALEALLRVWKGQRKRGFVGLCLVAMLPADAGLGDWLAFDLHLEEAIPLIAQTGMVDIDVGMCAEAGARLAAEAGESERAKLAYRLALQNWKHLGNQDRVDGVLRALNVLPR